MEVAQIARAIAYALKLNEDMTEALALVHDIGHPPFGHAGERALDEAMREFGLGFDHNLHALRIVEYFEVRYAAFRGLNLTLGVREGIVKHSRNYSPAEHPELGAYFLDQQPPLEAQLIDLADEIAYLTADMDDGIEAGMLHPEMLRQHVRIFDDSLRAVEREYPGAAEKLLANEALKKMLNTLVGDLIRETARGVSAAGISSLEDVRRSPQRLVAFSPGDRGAAPRGQATFVCHSLQQRGVTTRPAGGGFGGTESFCMLGERSVAVAGCLPVPDQQPGRGPRGRRLYRGHDG